ncbi:13856_t:CDS:2, partial [Racocetra persica]
LDEILYSHRKIVNEIMKSKDISMSSGFTFEEFQEILSSDERISSVNEANLRIIFEQLQRKQERRQRRKLDAFKSILKHFESMIAPEATWEQVRPILEKTEEFQAVGSEEQRVEIFTKFMERVKEKHLEKSGEDSEEEEGTIKDEDFEDDRHASSDRKKKHKSHRSYHHRRPHHSDYSADSADLSDKEKDGSDKRKRRKTKLKYESRYTEPKYQEYNKFTDPKHGEHKSLSPKSEIIKQTSPKPEESIKFQSPIRDFPQREVSKHADSSAEEGDYVQNLECNEEYGFGNMDPRK